MVAQTISQTIHKECNKPLQSKWYVETKNKSKFDWKFHKSSSYTVRKSGGLWLCYDRQSSMSDTERKQWELYRQLKRQYNQEQRQLQKQADEIKKQKIELAKEKSRATAHKKSIQLLSGLASAPRYDRIYSGV